MIVYDRYILSSQVIDPIDESESPSGVQLQPLRKGQERDGEWIRTYWMAGSLVHSRQWIVREAGKPFPPPFICIYARSRSVISREMRSVGEKQGDWLEREDIYLYTCTRIYIYIYVCINRTLTFSVSLTTTKNKESMLIFIFIFIVFLLSLPLFFSVLTPIYNECLLFPAIDHPPKRETARNEPDRAQRKAPLFI